MLLRFHSGSIALAAILIGFLRPFRFVLGTLTESLQFHADAELKMAMTQWTQWTLWTLWTQWTLFLFGGEESIWDVASFCITATVA